MRFIDLFAGLGGFHLALVRLGHRCVFACELDEALAQLYERNFGIRPVRDIRQVSPRDIPAHDVLCAGFPCQPFSKAGDQRGFACGRSGDLFEYVVEVLRQHSPRHFILENVPHLLRHHGGRTWDRVQKALTDAGYDFLTKRLSPHRFGIPQIRDRLFVVGSRELLRGFQWPQEDPDAKPSLTKVLDHNPGDARSISTQVKRCLDVWQDFLDRYPRDEKLPSFPIWSMEFGADYPYEDTTPHALGTRRLCRHRGSHGASLRERPPQERMIGLPSYARVPQDEFPRWKITFIRQNRELYERNKAWIDDWLPRVLTLPPSLQKFEWNCQGEERNIWQYVIQFRASGVRVKRPTTAPSLVAMTSTQVPIIAWEKRYMTPLECARLQSMKALRELPSPPNRAYRAFGNAVNVEVVARIARALTAPAAPQSARSASVAPTATDAPRSAPVRIPT